MPYYIKKDLFYQYLAILSLFGCSCNNQVYFKTLPNYFNFTLQVADVSVDVGVASAEDKHFGIVVPAVHAVDDPHWQVEPVHILLSFEGAPHAAAEPHVQASAVQVSVFPLHVDAQHEVAQAPVEQHN